MKKTVSILTALSIGMNPMAQRAYAQEETVQVQQNVEESKASNVWNTVKECAGKAASAAVENKGKILGVSGTALLLGTGYNGVTFRESIKTILAAEDITMTQKVQLIAKVLFLRKEISAAELENLKNQNIINDSNAIIKENESVIASADKELKGIATEQENLNKRKAAQEKNKKDAENNRNDACENCMKAEKGLGKKNKCGKACNEKREENKGAVKPEVKPEAKPEVKTEVKPEIKPEAKPEVKTEVKPEVKPEAKSEVK